MSSKTEERKDNPVFKKLPSVDHLMKTKDIADLAAANPRALVLKSVRDVLESIRTELKDQIGKNQQPPIPDESEILEQVRAHVKSATRMGMRRVVNAAGIILHTGMGRAVMPGRAVEALKCMSGYVNVQADPETGKRSQRDAHVEKLICQLTGAEAATVVNNNAAATMIALNTLAEGKEVIVSRGQLIEIGGAFRLPEVMKKSGVIMKEVGTTNRTHLRDYEEAISENTGAIFKAHPSNYRIQGFTTEPDITEIMTLAKKRGIPVVDDLGSGALIDFAPFGFHHEPLVERSVKAGAELVLFSGDKLIGGPQSGILIGSREIIKKIRVNPLARVFRVCKMTLCALEATLFLYFDHDMLMKEMPTFMMLSRDLETLTAMASLLAEKLHRHAPSFHFAVEDDVSFMGSGSLPMEAIKTKVVAISSTRIDCDSLALSLRTGDFPIFSRIRDNKVILDLRTVLDGEDEVILRAFQLQEKKLGRKSSPKGN